MKIISNKDSALSRLLTHVRTYLSILAVILAGPIVIHIPLESSFLQELAPRFGIFLVIILLWEFLIRFISKYIFRPQRQYSKLIKAVVFFFSFLLSVALLYSVGHLEDKITHEFLALFLISLGIRGLAQGFLLAGYNGLSFLCLMLYLFGVANFSGALAAVSWYWPFLIIAFALQAGLHAGFYLENLQTIIDKLKPGEKNTSLIIFSRLHAAVLIIAPASICLLQYLGYFPKSYLICLLSLALVLRSSELSRKLEKQLIDTKEEMLKCIKKITILSCSSTIVFIACFTLAGLIDL